MKNKTQWKRKRALKTCLLAMIQREKHVVSTTWKPFGAYFELKLKMVDVSCNSTLPVNPLYQPEFVTKLQKSWLPMSPFWSSMLRGVYNIVL